MGAGSGGFLASHTTGRLAPASGHRVRKPKVAADGIFAPYSVSARR